MTHQTFVICQIMIAVALLVQGFTIGMLFGATHKWTSKSTEAPKA
jgi:hypothetical protein